MTRERVQWHLDVPVCSTWHGLTRHLYILSMGELWELCFYFKAVSLSDLRKRMWAIIKKREVLS